MSSESVIFVVVPPHSQSRPHTHSRYFKSSLKSWLSRSTRRSKSHDSQQTIEPPIVYGRPSDIYSKSYRSLASQFDQAFSNKADGPSRVPSEISYLAETLSDNLGRKVRLQAVDSEKTASQGPGDSLTAADPWCKLVREVSQDGAALLSGEIRGLTVGVYIDPDQTGARLFLNLRDTGQGERDTEHPLSGISEAGRSCLIDLMRTDRRGIAVVSAFNEYARKKERLGVELVGVLPWDAYAFNCTSVVEILPSHHDLQEPRQPAG